MALNPGTRLGPYEVTAQIGEGGMGQVYRATDTKLKRQVAIKILPSALAADHDRLARFQREAEVLASLNHPHIAGIYGLEESGGVTALVMEFVDGEDLSERIARGPIPIDEALPIAKQIAEALEAAHEQGIIHRDLKPANIKVRVDGTVKVLDFGLAKAIDGVGPAGRSGAAGMTQSPTITTPAMTQAGMILGTAAYMSPEQARGRPVDRRADIWAFGVVLFEMLTGRRAFKGDDVSITLASVLMQEPDWSGVPAGLPAGLRRLLVRCLKKDPKARLRDIGEARVQIEELISGASDVGAEITPGPKPEAGSLKPAFSWRRTLMPAVAAAAFTAAAFVLFGALWRSPAENVVRFQIAAPDKSTFNNALVLSPDGRHVVFTTSLGGEGGGQIWVRSLGTLQPRRVAPWTQNPVPFWSSDSRFIAYQQDGKLKKVDITGGPPATLCDAPRGFGGGAWYGDTILFGDRGGGLMQVSSAGGVPVPLTTLDEKRQEISHALPSFLPDGRHFVYLRRSSNPEFTGVYIGVVGTPPDRQDATRLVASNYAAVYTPAVDPRPATRGLGFLLFLREATLMAQPFDAAKLTLKGEPAPIAEQVGGVPYGLGRFTASESGALAYSAGTGGTNTRLIWVDRRGANVGILEQPGGYGSLSISPDGSRVAVEKLDGPNSDLWLIDSAPGGKSDRFTFFPYQETAPVWSADGTQIAFAALQGNTTDWQFFTKPSNMAGEEVVLFKSNERKEPSDWSRDGKTLLFTSVVGSPNLWSMALGTLGKDASDKDEVKAQPFLTTEAAEYRGRLSPDGRWIAYASDATGRFEIYVRPFPLSADRRGQWLVSNGGGDWPIWRKDGKELFYRRTVSTATMMAVEVTTGAVFKSEQPKELFQWPALPAFITQFGYDWDATADGSRFLLNVRASDSQAPIPITVVLNWTADLKK